MSIPPLDVDFYSDEVIKDPYPVYETMRELGPVVYLPKNDHYALPRYHEVSDVLRQPLRFVSSRGVSPIPKVNDILVGSTLNSDPPEHDRTRAVTSEPLLPGALKAIEPRLQEAANGLVEEAVRMATPIRAFTRYVIEDSDIAGHRIPAGSRVLAMFASANLRLGEGIDDVH